MLPTGLFWSADELHSAIVRHPLLMPPQARVTEAIARMAQAQTELEIFTVIGDSSLSGELTPIVAEALRQTSHQTAPTQTAERSEISRPEISSLVAPLSSLSLDRRSVFATVRSSCVVVVDRSLDRPPLDPNLSSPHCPPLATASGYVPETISGTESETIPSLGMGTVLGIVTEGDIVRLLAQGASLEQLTLAAVMQSPHLVLPEVLPHDACSDRAALLSQLQHLSSSPVPVVNDRGDVVGLVTATSLQLAQSVVLNVPTPSSPSIEVQPPDLPKSDLQPPDLQASDLQPPHSRKPNFIKRLVDNLPGVIFQFAPSPNAAPATPTVTPTTAPNITDIRQGVLRFISHGVEVLTGYSPTLFYAGQQTLGGLIHPADRELVRTRVQQAIDQSIPYRIEYRLQTRSGHYLWLQEQGQGYYDSQGKLLWLDAIAINITDLQQTKANLKESEARYRALLEGASDAIFLADIHGNITEVNRQAEQLTGYSRQQLTQMHIQQLHPPCDHERAIAAFRETCNQDRRSVLNLGLLCADGSAIPVDITGTVLEINGSLVVLGIFRDARERKRIEEQLRRQEAHLLSAQRIAKLGSWEFEIGSRQITWSDEVFHLFGYDPAQKPPSYDELQALLHPDDRQQHDLLIQQAITSGQAYEMELRVQLPHRSEHTLLVRGEAILDDQGQSIRLLGTVLDITDRLRSQAALQATEAKLKAILKYAPMAIFVKDVEGRYLLINDNFPLGRQTSTADCLGKTDLEIFPEATARQFRANDQHVWQVGHTCEFQETLEDGEITYTFLSTKFLLRDEADRPYALGGISADITARQAAEIQLQKTNQELARATRLKDEFLANMSHELRTPLNAILGMSEVLQESILGDLNADQQQAITTIEQSGSHLLELINDILDLSKIEAGKVELERSTVPVDELCQSSLSFIQHLAMKKSIRLVVDIPDEIRQFCLWVDRRRVRQVLINLLNNAVKFTPDHGEITLSVQLETHVPHSNLTTGSVPSNLGFVQAWENPQTWDLLDESAPATPIEPDQPSPHHPGISFTVADTGIGIAEQDQSKLFQAFVQIDSSLSRHYEGTGLGLTLAKRVVELHGGTIGLVSEPNVGSQFTIYLPPSCLSGMDTRFGVRSGFYRAGANLLSRLSVAGGSGLAETPIATDRLNQREFLGEDQPESLLDDPLNPSLDQQADQQADQLADQQAGKRSGDPDAADEDVRSVPRSGFDPSAELTNYADRLDTSLESLTAYSSASIEYLLRHQQHPLRAISILVVEDNATNLEMIASYLEKVGYRILTAENGREAIELAETTYPDLILMDVHMPVMDGLTAVQQMRSMVELAEIPIVALTALAMDGDQERCLSAGFSDYLPKPVPLKSLAGQVANWLKSSLHLQAKHAVFEHLFEHLNDDFKHEKNHD